MLATILASYLNMSEVQADQLLELVSHEQMWSEEQPLNDVRLNLAEAETQADVIKFVQALGQSKWFRGHDRSKFATTPSKDNDKYFSIFTGLGLTQAMPYNPADGEPEFSVILGSSESQVRAALGALEADLEAGHTPRSEKIYGLGGDRPLGTAVLESEQYSKKRLTELQVELTEANMVDLIVSDKLIELEMRDAKFRSLTYQGINTVSAANDRSDKDRVTTGDTAASLKRTIEETYNTSVMQKPIIVAIYTNQPFILRQTRDMQLKLGPDYKVVGLGRELKREDFNKYPQAIAIVEGEVARLININFRPEILSQFDVPLTAEEKAQIKKLISESAQKSTSTAINKIDNVTTLFAVPASTTAVPAPPVVKEHAVHRGITASRK